MRIVFGIGNPGPEYVGTRHNVGFDVVDELARRAGAVLQPLRGFEARGAPARRAGRLLLLVQPTTYVNRSGPVAAALLRHEAREPGDLLVVVDDYQLPLGRLRLRGAGSDGGHNGLSSIAAALGGEAWPRLRVGIGHPGGGPARDFVLGRFAEGEREAATGAVARAADAVERWAREGLERAMNEVNRRDLDPPADRA